MLSRELSAQAGRDLYRLAREGDRIVLPARIGGTVASPTVFVDVAVGAPARDPQPGRGRGEVAVRSLDQEALTAPLAAAMAGQPCGPPKHLSEALARHLRTINPRA